MPLNPKHHRHHWSLFSLLAAYLLLAGWYQLHIPLFEAPDAYYHFAVIEHIARTGEYPSGETPREEPWRQMTYHAPLYYALSAALIRPFDTSDYQSRYPLNPHAQIGQPGARDNTNFVAHIGDPLAGTGLAARVVRLFSTALGAVTLAGVYTLGRLCVPHSRGTALLATLIVALIPQYLFIHAVITNDALVIALNTIGLVLIVWQMRTGVTLPRVILLAVVLALASLAKASGLVLYPIAAAGLLWACWQQRIPWRRVLLYGAVGLGMWYGLAGWWYLTNWQLYGDPTAVSQVAAATGSRGVALTPAQIVGEMRGLYYSFWGLFGWFNIDAPQAFYHSTMLLLAAAGGGVIRGVAGGRGSRRRHAPLLVVTGLYVVLLLAGWWQFHQLVNAAQGRLWFPALPVLALVLAWGLRFVWRPVTLLLIAGLGLAAVALPPLVIAPAYAPPHLIDAAVYRPPADAVPVHFREPWQSQACLTLWTQPPRWRDENTLEIPYLWQAHCPVSGYWSVFVHLIDPQRETCITGDTGHIRAQVDTMPAGGRLPLPALPPGHMLEDRLTLTVPDGAKSAQEQYIHTGLYDAGGTFMRAFIHLDAPTEDIRTGRCGPETVLLTVPPR